MATQKYGDIKKFAPVIVTWGDALTHYEEKSSAQLLKDDKPCERRTIGFFIGATRWHIILAMENDTAYKDPESDCQTVTKIRHGMVIRVRKLR